MSKKHQETSASGTEQDLKSSVKDDEKPSKVMQGYPCPYSEVQNRVLMWFSAEKRDLPWRKSRDPWLILVSEVMLQQTQVARVIPKFEAFCQRFPTPNICANATAREVLQQWTGLGYNRRGLGLHRCAQVIRDEHGGHVPRDEASLLALPGIGRYTAAAIRSFAFGCHEAVVDTNVGRILARTILGRGERSRTVLQECADDLLGSEDSWTWNQALMDFGSSVCQKRNPACSRCPIQEHCAWQQQRRLNPDTPDPAASTVTRSLPQARFEGSNRQLRGTLVRLALDGGGSLDDVARSFGRPIDEVQQCAEQLRDEGLVAYHTYPNRLSPPSH